MCEGAGGCEKVKIKFAWPGWLWYPACVDWTCRPVDTRAKGGTMDHAQIWVYHITTESHGSARAVTGFPFPGGKRLSGFFIGELP